MLKVCTRVAQHPVPPTPELSVMGHVVVFENIFHNSHTRERCNIQGRHPRTVNRESDELNFKVGVKDRGERVRRGVGVGRECYR